MLYKSYFSSLEIQSFTKLEDLSLMVAFLVSLMFSYANCKYVGTETFIRNPYVEKHCMDRLPRDTHYNTHMNIVPQLLRYYFS